MMNWLQNTIKPLVLTCCLLTFACNADAQKLALRNNALLDIACVPNLSLDVALGRKTSISIEGFASWTLYGHKFKTYGVIPEFRYWFAGRTFTHWFVGVDMILAAYKVQFRSTLYDGECYGGGITFGYDFNLGRHWSLDLHAGVAPVYYNHRRSFQDDVLDSPTEYKEHGIAILPLQVGVSFVYIIK
ncbi:MAG: DUF3575 domain-containing protein [Bacteroidaceae bacterium]|nr:DUF3575 domain-containing protein [Bacteroidaceae bacterium]